MAISAQSFYLDRDSADSLQHQIRKMVIQRILSGQILPGDKMPSSRALARHLGVSRITVTLAYTDLVANDYLAARGRSGYFVSETAPRPPKFAAPPGGARQDDVDWARRLPDLAGTALGPARPADWRDYPYPFIYGQADARLFDHQNWRLCAVKALGRRDFPALTSDYYLSDDAELIDFITRQILPRRGIDARPDEVLLTMGAQNALWLTSHLILSPDKTAAVESPSYPGLREVIAQTGASMAHVPVDARGLRLDLLPRTDAVFVTPSHQAPTNVTLDAARRRALLDRATAEDFLVVEDDYEFEVSFARAPLPALKSMDRNGRVIYVGSFSKSLFPGLRLGYLVASEPFIRQARALRASILRHPPGHIQRTLAYFLSLGHYDTQLSRMARVLSGRRAVMAEALERHGLAVASNPAEGGSSFWMRAPEGIDTAELAETLRGRGVVIEPGQSFFADPAEGRRYFRLAYSSIAAAQIPEGIRRIAETLGTT